MLIGHDPLTSGTTWHSAAQVTNVGMTQTMDGLKSHAMAFKKELRDDPDDPVGYDRGDGGIRLANAQAQIDGYRHFASMAAGMESEVIDAAECAPPSPHPDRQPAGRPLGRGRWTCRPRAALPAAGPARGAGRRRGEPARTGDRADAARRQHMDPARRQGPSALRDRGERGRLPLQRGRRRDGREPSGRGDGAPAPQPRPTPPSPPPGTGCGCCAVRSATSTAVRRWAAC